MIFETTVNFEPTSLKRHRHTRNGRTYDPSTKDKSALVRLLHLPEHKMSLPIRCTLKFFSSRPKSHYRTGKYSGLLKSTAPKFNTCRKDIDNMAKFILDALNNKLYVDDCQIIYLNCEKHYTTDHSHIYMKFEEIQDSEDLNPQACPAIAQSHSTTSEDVHVQDESSNSTEIDEE